MTREQNIKAILESVFSQAKDELIDIAVKNIMTLNDWIPVNERLPEEGTYLVAIKRFDGTTTTDIMSFAKDLNKVDEFDFPKHKSGWYNYDSEFGYYENADVKAWMPLPKP